MVSTIDGRGNTTVREYWANQLAYVRDPLQKATCFPWPQFLGTSGQSLPWYGPIAVTDPLGNTSYYQYDSYGHQIAATNPLGATSYYEYEGNLLTAVTTPLNETTYYGYGAYGQRLWQVDGPVRYWEYYDNGYVTAETDVLGQTTYYSYLNGGRTVMGGPASR